MNGMKQIVNDDGIEVKCRNCTRFFRTGQRDGNGVQQGFCPKFPEILDENSCGCGGDKFKPKTGGLK